MSFYESICREALTQIQRPDVPWQVLEGFMRLWYGTLDHLDHPTFLSEARLAAAAYDENPAVMLETAASYGLRVEP